MIFIFLGDGASSSEQIPSGIAGMLQKALQQRSGALGWSSRWDLFIFNNFCFHGKKTHDFFFFSEEENDAEDDEDEWDD